MKSRGATSRTIKAVAGPLARLARLAGENVEQEVASIEEDFHKGNVQQSYIVAKIEEAKKQLKDQSQRRLVAYLDVQQCLARLDRLLKISRDRQKENMK